MLPSPLVSGSIFAGDFRIERPLAQGGMGMVYVAHQLSTDRVRALKVMLPSVASSEDARRRFEQEARIGAKIASDHIVEVVACGVDGATGAPWLAMELLQGKTLHDLLEEQLALEPALAMELFAQLGHALAAGHDQGVVHRDIKPENVFLAAGRRADGAYTVKVLDFGIAKLITQTSPALTRTIGTPLWMAPEQTQANQPITAATDVWAMGLVAFRMLSGKCFWKAASDPEAGSIQVVRELAVDPIPRASERAAELGARALPRGFDDWFARCVHRDVAQRFPHARPATESLAAVLRGDAGATLLAPPAPFTQSHQFASSPTAQSHPVPPAPSAGSAKLVGIVAAAVIVVGCIAAVVVVLMKKPRVVKDDRDDDRAEVTERPRPATSTSTSAAGAPPSSSAPSAAVSAASSAVVDDGTVGIPECDQYMQLWRDCYKDPLVRARAETGFKNMARDMRKVASEGPKEREDTRAMCEDNVKKFPKALCK